MGTLSGALVGAAIFGLPAFYLDKWSDAQAQIARGGIIINPTTDCNMKGQPQPMANPLVTARDLL